MQVENARVGLVAARFDLDDWAPIRHIHNRDAARRAMPRAAAKPSRAPVGGLDTVLPTGAPTFPLRSCA